MKKLIVLLAALFLLTACGQAVEGGVVIRTADPNIAFFIPVAPAPPAPIDEPDVKPMDCSIKGNISADGRKLYHMPDSPNYSQTVIDESKGEQWFCTEVDAQAAGWTKAGQ